MKKLLALCITILLMASCNDLIETDGSGKLGGNWQLIQVDTLATGGVRDMSSDRKFMAVEGSILQLSDADDGREYIFQYAFDASTLALSDARINNREANDPTVTDLSLLSPYGLSHIDQTFEIEKISGGQLVMRTDRLRLYFRKM